GGAASGARVEPGALIGVLLAVEAAAGVVGPAACRVLVRHLLVPLVAEGDGVAVQGAGAVHEADAATRAGVHVVGLVAEGEVTVGGGDRAAGQRAVAVVVVPRAVL